ncbi:MAG: GerMN domain-containing protein [Clostridia bacterium]|nr:GerMN domain-containing protein [Clostridia bacterium]
MTGLGHKNKKHVRWQWTVVFLLLAGVFVFLFGCGTNKEDAKDLSESRTPPPKRIPFLVQNQETVLVYFATVDGKNLVPVTLSINPTNEVAKVAVEKCLAGPENEFTLPVIPEETKLKNLLIQVNTVYVDLTSEITQVDSEKAKLAIDSLVLTLTEFNEVEDVQILVDGQIPKTIGGVDTSKPIKRPMINLYGGEGKEEVKVFYSDSNAMYLVPVTFRVSVNDLPYFTLKKLVEGPPNKSGLVRTLWNGAKVISYSVQEGIATVDFSREVLGYGGGTTAETMFVDSVVQTLTQLESVDAVQFLFAGEKLDYLPEGTDVSSPISGTAKINYRQ